MPAHSNHTLELQFKHALEELLSHEALSSCNRRFLIGCSGGADSLSLALLCQRWQKALRGKFFVCVVDHGLRENSDTEAKQTWQWLLQNGFSSHLRTVRDKPDGNLQQFARRQRRQLLAECAQELGCEAIMLAHHRRDQAETVLDRLARGSHALGLSGIQPISIVQGVRILRPLLSVSPDRLRQYANARHAPIIDDPSNQQRRFRRVKIRQLLQKRPALETLALQVASAARLPAGVELAACRLFWQSHIQEPFAGILCATRHCWLQYPDAVAHRVIGSSLRYVGGTTFPPRYASIVHLYAELREGLRRGTTFQATLGGAKIRLDQEGVVWFMPENRALSKKILCHETLHWGKHWRITHNQRGALELQIMGRGSWKRLFPKHRHWAFLGESFPCLRDGKREFTPFDEEKNADISFHFQPLNIKGTDLSKTGLYFASFYPIS